MATTFSSRDFNQRSGDAKKAASKGPVMITDRGRATHVLLSIEDYRKLASTGRGIAELLAESAVSANDFDAELERIRTDSNAPGRSADLG
jgi:prevent-host-death family protein